MAAYTGLRSAQNKGQAQQIALMLQELQRQQKLQDEKEILALQDAMAKDRVKWQYDFTEEKDRESAASKLEAYLSSGTGLRNRVAKRRAKDLDRENFSSDDYDVFTSGVEDTVAQKRARREERRRDFVLNPWVSAEENVRNKYPKFDTFKPERQKKLLSNVQTELRLSQRALAKDDASMPIGPSRARQLATTRLSGLDYSPEAVNALVESGQHLAAKDFALLLENIVDSEVDILKDLLPNMSSGSYGLGGYASGNEGGMLSPFWKPAAGKWGLENPLLDATESEIVQGANYSPSELDTLFAQELAYAIPQAYFTGTEKGAAKVAFYNDMMRETGHPITALSMIEGDTGYIPREQLKQIGALTMYLQVAHDIGAQQAASEGYAGKGSKSYAKQYTNAVARMFAEEGGQIVRWVPRVQEFLKRMSVFADRARNEHLGMTTRFTPTFKQGAPGVDEAYTEEKPKSRADSWGSIFR